MFTIALPSGIVNGVIFVVVDVLALWAVNRGILALQGYLMFRAASKGSPISLKRSCIPIVSGELLAGSTFFSSLFPAFSAIVIVLAFLATLGVNGETQKLYDVPIERDYITSLFNTTRDAIKMDDPFLHVFCRDSNVSHISYWPLAFDSSDSSSSPTFLYPNKSSIVCLRDVQGVTPMLSIRNCLPDWITCISWEDRTTIEARFSWSVPKYDVLYNISYAPLPSETQFRQVLSNDELAPDKTIGLALQVDNTTDDYDSLLLPGDLVLAKGHPPSDLKNSSETFHLHAMRLRYHPNASTSADVVFGVLSISMAQYNDIFKFNSTFNYGRIAHQSFDVTINSADATMEGEFLGKGPAVLLNALHRYSTGLTGYTLQDHLDDFVTTLLHPEPLTSRIYTTSTRDVTSINKLSLVLLASLAVAGAVLGGIRELLLAIIAGKSKEARRALTAAEYDTLSRMYRSDKERMGDLPLSGLAMQLCVSSNVTASNFTEEFDSAQSYVSSGSGA